jgi:hypothetical protein
MDGFIDGTKQAQGDDGAARSEWRHKCNFLSLSGSPPHNTDLFSLEQSKRVPIDWDLGYDQSVHGFMPMCCW